MAVEKLDIFRNINYDYKDQHDTFVGRGLHLNMLNDQLSMVIDEVNVLSGTISANWIDNGTSLSPATSGHDILLRDNTERIVFGDGDTFFYEISDDVPGLYVLGNAIQTWYTSGISIYGNIYPQTTTKTRDLGSSTRFWRNLYTERVYIDDLATFIHIDTGNMMFTDAVAGTVTLASLVGGGSTYTFDSGLTEVAGNVDIGGALTADAIFSGSFNFYIGSASGTVTNAVMYSSTTSQLRSTGTARIGWDSAYPVPSTLKYIELSATAMEVYDSDDSKGLVYAADYSTAGEADDLWIPSWGSVKAYADSVGGGTGNVSWGTATNSYLVFGSATGDIESDSDIYIERTGDNNALHINSTGATGRSTLWLKDNGTNFGQIDSYGGNGLKIKTDTGYLWLESNFTTPRIVLGTSQTNAFLSIGDAGSSDSVVVRVMSNLGAINFEVMNDGSIDIPLYGSGTFTGTAAYSLAVDSSGNLIEIASSGGGTVTSVSSSTTNQLTVANGTTTPALSIVTGAVTPAGTALATGGEIVTYVTGLGYSTTVGTVTSVSGTGTVDGITLSGTVTSSGNLTLSGNVSVSSVTGTLPVANGGTGLTTIGTNYLVTGNGTAAMTAEPNLTFTGATLAVTGAITATGEITAYASDIRLKTEIERIDDPVNKIKQLNGVTYKWKQDVCKKVGFVPVRTRETGMIAQNLRAVIEDAVSLAPFDRDDYGYSISGENYLTVNLEKNIPLIIEALKEVIFRLEKIEKR